mmetsp:Transcript_75958/g.180643  ORF Transcript_75958/g.180643 Transcript_75958/m.180643 type:complete len:252 (+) Transcript_75958:1397-2152(+)
MSALPPDMESLPCCRPSMKAVLSASTWSPARRFSSSRAAMVCSALLITLEALLSLSFWPIAFCSSIFRLSCSSTSICWACVRPRPCSRPAISSSARSRNLSLAATNTVEPRRLPFLVSSVEDSDARLLAKHSDIERDTCLSALAGRGAAVCWVCPGSSWLKPDMLKSARCTDSLAASTASSTIPDASACRSACEELSCWQVCTKGVCSETPWPTSASCVSVSCGPSRGSTSATIFSWCNSLSEPSGSSGKG